MSLTRILSLVAASPDSPAQAVTREVLARRATGGDRDALETLLRVTAPDVHALCHHVAGRTDGPDAAQRALERLVVNLDRFDPERGSFRTWALTVARNVCRDRQRRRGLERATFADEGDAMTARHDDPAPSPERIVLARIDAEHLAHALQDLPEPMRSAIVLFHVHGSSYEDIAATLDVPKGTVMTWLHRGRRRLRDALGEESR